jgi:hypothetical protein
MGVKGRHRQGMAALASRLTAGSSLADEREPARQFVM